MIEAGAEIINNSWTPGYWVEAHHFRAENEDGELDLEQTRENLDHYLWHRGMLPGEPEEVSVADFYGQSDRHPSERTIFVWSAGNNFGRRITATINLKHYGGPVLDKGGTVAADSLAVVPGLSYYFSDLTLNNVGVAAISEFSQVVSTINGREVVQREIASFSNRCGENAESFCISAPGVATFGYSDADLSVAFEEAAREINCRIPETGLTHCVLEARELAISIIVRERVETGYGAGFLLAPETEDYLNGYLPPRPGHRTRHILFRADCLRRAGAGETILSRRRRMRRATGGRRRGRMRTRQRRTHRANHGDGRQARDLRELRNIRRGIVGLGKRAHAAGRVAVNVRALVVGGRVVFIFAKRADSGDCGGRFIPAGMVDETACGV